MGPDATSGERNLSYLPKKGDVVWVDFDPSVGKEIRKRRPGLVISADAFNATTGFAVIVPIKTRQGVNPLEVPLPESMKTTGAAQTYQMRSMYLSPRRPEFIERAPDHLTSSICERAQLIIADSVA